MKVSILYISSLLQIEKFFFDAQFRALDLKRNTFDAKLVAVMPTIENEYFIRVCFDMALKITFPTLLMR